MSSAWDGGAPPPPSPPPVRKVRAGAGAGAGAGAAAPRRYVRVRSKRRRHEVQTAVTTFSRVEEDGSTATVDLHAQLHFGTHRYFSHYNGSLGDGEGFGSWYDRVLYELVVGQDMVEAEGGKDGALIRRLLPADDGRSPVMASPGDVGTANSYGLECQANVVNYAQDGWYQADLTREEFLAEMERTRTAGVAGAGAGGGGAGQPLWALASSSTVFPGYELVSALLRPSTPSTNMSRDVTRRLFSNLFLPGDSLAATMRAVLWLAVPAPEVSIMLLDWSSLTPRPTGGISPTALPVLECLLGGNVREARMLVFGQMVVSGQAAAGMGATSASESVLIGRRNERAMEVLRSSVERDGCRNTALLYGASHCLDLERRLRAMGYSPVSHEWRTSWSVDVPEFGIAPGRRVGGERRWAPAFVSDLTSASGENGIAVSLVVLPLYLAVGGMDWVSTIREVADALGRGEMGNGIFEAGFYLARHVALYVGLAKFVVEWDGNNLFGGEGTR